MKIIALSILSISLNSFAAQTADKPLSTLSTGDVKPNVMFIIDDSGSMAWSHMPDDVISWPISEKRTVDWRKTVGYRSALCNGVYYNPDTNYLPPKNANGTDMPNSNFNSAWYDGFSMGSPSTIDLAKEFIAYDQRTGYVKNNYNEWNPNIGTAGEGGAIKVQAFYWALNSGVTFDKNNPGPQCSESPKGKIDSNSADSTTSWTKVLVPDATQTAAVQDAQKTNFANWFSYYRTRMLMMKSSSGAAFNSIGDRYRVGFSSINNLKNGIYNEQSFLNINNYASTQKQAWYSMLYAVSPNGGTPLKAALNAVGQIYSGNGSTLSSYISDPMDAKYTCQQNFTILTTDGYWNQPTRNSDPDPVSVGDTDSSSKIPIPMNDPNAQKNTLADVAMYYFKRDIRPLMKDNVPGVEAFADGLKGRQLMRTYTLGMGMDGELKRSDHPAPYTKAIPWPVAVGDTKTTIDDLWHAAVNGGGEYFSAKDPNAVAAGLSKALSDIESKTASVGSADVSNSFMSQDSRSIYFTSFETISWIGDVKARKVNLETSALEADTWSAKDQLKLLGHSNRKIYTCSDTACSSRADFDKDNRALVSAMAAGVTALKTSNGTMSSEQSTQNTAAALIDYLRGDQSNEIQSDAKNAKSLYRARKGLLGAVIHGGVSYVQKPRKAYGDADYPAFLRSQSKRAAMAYVPANDGMLHAFNAETGAEEWAFVPPTVIPRLWQQAERAFSNDFKYFVDGAPTIADIQVGTTWKTILVAGLRGGGGEYYALDITDPLNPLPLWSFSDSKLGKTYGFPVVGKVNKTWKVLLSSGYDNADNKGYLFALNANTGTLDNTFSSSCSSSEGLCALSKIGVLFENENVDDTIIMAYAGDLSGKLWRFDPNDGSSALVAQTGLDKQPQAITTAPVIKIAQQKSSTNMPLHYITFGTGRYLSHTDKNLESSDKQTFYGLLVDPSASEIDTDFKSLRSSNALSALTFEQDGDNINLKRAKSSGTPETINDCKKRIKGWRADMLVSNERLANDAEQLEENAIFITSIPGGNACEAEGYSRQYSLPTEISSNWVCSNASSDKFIKVGKGKNGSMLDDPSKNPTMMTPKGVGKVGPNGDPVLQPYDWKFKGRRSGWTEIVK